MCPRLCCKMPSSRGDNSLMCDVCETFRHASLRVKSPTGTKFHAVQEADRGRPLSSCRSTYCRSQFYSATCTYWFCSISYAEIPVAVVESEIRIAYFRQVAPLCVINLMNSGLTDVFRTKRR